MSAHDGEALAGDDLPAGDIETAQIQPDRNSVARPPLTAGASFFPYLVLIFAVAATGSSAIFVKLADMPGPVFGFYRMAIAITLSAVPVSVQVKRSPPFSRRHLWLALVGGLFLALDLWVWNNAVLITSAANATLFGNTSVFWVAVGSILLFHERLRPAFWSGLALTLTGILVILGQDFLIHPTLGIGDSMSILAGFFYGAFFLATAYAREKLNAFMAWWLSSFASALVLVIVVLAQGLPLSGYSLQTYLYILGAALLTQMGGYIAVNYTLGHLPASSVSTTLLAQPVFTAILGLLVLNQSVGISQVIGGALVLAGIFIVHRSNTRG